MLNILVVNFGIWKFWNGKIGKFKCKWQKRWPCYVDAMTMEENQNEEKYLLLCIDAKIEDTMVCTKNETFGKP